MNCLQLNPNISDLKSKRTSKWTVAPKWHIEPSDTSVVRGASASIDCMTSGFPPPRIIWTKASGDQPAAQQTPIGQQSSGQSGQSAASLKSEPRQTVSHHLGSWVSVFPVWDELPKQLIVERAIFHHFPARIFQKFQKFPSFFVKFRPKPKPKVKSKAEDGNSKCCQALQLEILQKFQKSAEKKAEIQSNRGLCLPSTAQRRLCRPLACQADQATN